MIECVGERETSFEGSVADGGLTCQLMRVTSELLNGIRERAYHLLLSIHLVVQQIDLETLLAARKTKAAVSLGALEQLFG